VEQIKYCMNIQDDNSGSGDGSTGSSDNNNPDTNSPGN